jgi:hypothetical protein
MREIRGEIVEGRKRGRDETDRPSRLRVLFVAGLAVFLSGPAQTYGSRPSSSRCCGSWGVPLALLQRYSIGTLVMPGPHSGRRRSTASQPSRSVNRRDRLRVRAPAAELGSSALAILAGFALTAHLRLRYPRSRTRTLVPFWFVRHRGRAFSLLGLAGSLSLAAVPPVNQLLIESFGVARRLEDRAMVFWLVLLRQWPS